jgi:hypothetical protein
MSEAVLFPYPHLEAALSLSCDLGDLETETTPSGSLLIVQDLDEIDQISIDLVVRVAPGTRERVLPPFDDGWVEHQVVVTMNEPTTRLRRSIALQDAESDDEFRGHVVLDTTDLASEVALTPYLVLTQPSDDRRFARHVGAAVATGRQVDVLFREPPTPPGGYLEIEFEVFADSPNAGRRSNPSVLFALDLEGAYPKLWLNRGVDGFERIMRSVARRGAPRRIRDATYDSIIGQTWTSLLSTALAGLAASQSIAGESQSPLTDLPDWQQRVIYFWAQRLYPELNNRDQAIREITRVVVRPERLGEIQERMVIAVQNFASSPEVFRGLLRFETGEGL